MTDLQIASMLAFLPGVVFLIGLDLYVKAPPGAFRICAAVLTLGGLQLTALTYVLVMR